MKIKLFIKLFLASLFVSGVTSIFLFAWLARIQTPMLPYIPFIGYVSGYIISITSVSIVTSWWLEKSFFKILKENDASLHLLTHDLRNPVTAVRGFLSFLLDGTAGPINNEQRGMLHSIDRASMRILHIINNILDISKVEAGKMKLELSPIKLKEIAANVISMMEVLGEGKRLRFGLEGDDGNLNADSVLMERLITNLVSNAIKFCMEDGIVNIKIKEEPKYVVMEVSDDGEGIPPEYIGKIFEKYEQAGRKGKGTGLGLNLCNFVAQAHHGTITVKSEQGHGSTFTVTIPKNLSFSKYNLLSGSL